MDKKIWIAVGVVILLAVGYFLYSSNKTPKTTPTPETTTTTTPTPAKEIIIDLKASKDSSESGKATLTEEGGKVMVKLEMTGAPKGVSQPAHIHLGKCPDVGAVKFPLTSVVDGMSETTIDTTLDQLKSMMPIAINVHKSAAQSSIYVSCGDINL